MADERIIDLDTTVDVEADDFVVLDSSTAGTRKMVPDLFIQQAGEFFARLDIANSFLGIQSYAGAEVVEYTPMGSATEIDVAKAGNSRSLTTNLAMTISSMSPTPGTSTWLRLASDGTNRTPTFPDLWSLARGSIINSMLVPANTVLQVKLQFLNSRWEVIGDPVATIGSGSFVLSLGELAVAVSKILTASNTLTLAGTDGTTMTFPPASASIGYMGIPPEAFSADFTLAAADNGKAKYHALADNNARTVTINSNANLALPLGFCVNIENFINVVSIAITADTLYWFDGISIANTGTRTLAPGGVATLHKITSTIWIITGPGVA